MAGASLAGKERELHVLKDEGSQISIEYTEPIGP